MKGIVKGESIAPTPIWKIALGVLGAMLLIFIIWALFGNNSPEAQERMREREAIALCRERETDPLQELSTRRAARAACDAMERDFQEKWYAR